MFSVTSEQIGRLGDEDLRELVARLCEAEVRSAGRAATSVTWGGNQTSPDGGIDVRVALSECLPPSSTLQRGNCGFQVKAQDMGRSHIRNEMRPEGALRTSIAELAALSGSYIIASSQAAASDTTLRRRTDAMRQAVEDCADAASLHLDFYDANRLATWANQHAGVVIWVRQRVGAPIHNWQAYRNWSHPSESSQGDYLSDEQKRVLLPKTRSKVTTLDALTEMRRYLGKPKGLVRLVGLSGTGKTRFVQALFDDAIGQDALPSSLAVYTNISDSPEPQPQAMAEMLIAQRQRVVLVIDNCTPELHRSLCRICERPDSTVSLLTVEYDVREDQPEGTEVFELLHSSDPTIHQLLRRRFPLLSSVNADTIAHFSVGNARVALALAAAVRPSETLAELGSRELLRKLLHQGDSPNPSLERSAQACSLLYSFQGEDFSASQTSETARLSILFHIELHQLRADIRDLERRDLLQQRGVWRALLPHAIANPLARAALEELLPTELDAFWRNLPTRMLRSFSRRLGFLHTSLTAQTLARVWLTDLLAAVEGLDSDHLAILNNIAPIIPHDVLDALSQANGRLKQRGAALPRADFHDLLVLLAFEHNLFKPAFTMLVDITSKQVGSPYATQHRDALASFFTICLSGTHASLDLRLEVAESLLVSSDPFESELGKQCLRYLLKVSYFSSTRHFAFGGRPRDYGYQPTSAEDVCRWFRSVLLLCRRLLSGVLKQAIKDAVAEHFKSLWKVQGLQAELETLAQQIAEDDSWPEGWAACRSIRRYQRTTLSVEEYERLDRIEQWLQPTSLTGEVRTFVLTRNPYAFDDLDPEDFQGSYERTQKKAIALGERAGRDTACLEVLVPEVMSAGYAMFVHEFMLGVVRTADDLEELWRLCVDAYMSAPNAARSIEILAALLYQIHEREASLAQRLLGSAAQDTALCPIYPILQARLPLDEHSFTLLRNGILDSSMPVGNFYSFGFNRELCPDDVLASLLPHLAAKAGGADVIVSCLALRFHERPGEAASIPPSPTLIAAARDTLANDTSVLMDSQKQYDYKLVALRCFSGEEAEPAVRRLLEQLEKRANDQTYQTLSRVHFVVATLLSVNPKVCLDFLYARQTTEDTIGLDSFVRWGGNGCLNGVPPAALLDWCDSEPIAHYVWASNFLSYSLQEFEGPRTWNPVALEFIHRAAKPVEVLKAFLLQMESGGWTGSWADALEQNTSLLNELASHPDTALHEFIANEKTRLEVRIANERTREQQRHQAQNESFE